MYSPTQAYTPGEQLDSTRRLLVAMNEKGELQSYVAQHKNSPEYPFLLALATGINQVSNATRAAQYQPPTQTVADQKLNALAPAPAPQAPTQLPENVGIGQLPAPNLSTINKAEGGIVAFGDGGEVPRYQDQGLVRVPSLQYGYNTGFGNASRPGYTQAELAEAQRLREMGLFDLLKEKFGPAWQALTTPPAAKVKQETYQSGTDIGGPGSSPANMGAGVTAPTVSFENPTPADKQKPDAVTSAAVDKAGLASLSAPKISSKSAVKELEEAVYKNAPDKAAMMKEMADIDKPYLDKARANIEKEGKRLESAKEQDFYMSLIEGGLAAAGGESMYALQNIAKGGQKGVSSFNTALKEFRKATQENSRAEAELERYEATGKKDALKSYNEAQAKRDDRFAAGITALRAQEMQTQGTITAAGINAAASRDLANTYRAPALAEQIRQHLSKELDKDTRYAYDPVAKAAELQRRLEVELKKYPGMAQYAGTTGGGGAPSMRFNPQTGKIEPIA